MHLIKRQILPTFQQYLTSMPEWYLFESSFLPIKEIVTVFLKGSPDYGNKRSRAGGALWLWRGWTQHEWQQAHNDKSKPDSSEPAVPRPRFPFLGTVTHLLYGYVVRWEAMSKGHQSHHLGASVVVLFIQEIMKFLPLNMVRHRSQAQRLCVCVE